jgi:thymidylate synthase
MHLKYKNCNDAFVGVVSGIQSGRIPVTIEASRNGEVLRVEEPVILSYSHPKERCLFNESRDVNPFSLMYEALYMLSGRNDVAPLAYYSKQFAEYSDDGETLNGSYGMRWRNGYYYPSDEHAHYDNPFAKIEKGDYFYRCNGPPAVDQIRFIIDHLKAKPESRRAVLNMWDIDNDLIQIDTSRDVCCNLNICFSIEKGECKSCEGLGFYPDANIPSIDKHPCPSCSGTPSEQPRYLNMTVFNRSNDLLWGALGANYCVFSFLQEYIATALELDVGTYNQVSNNMHVYIETNSGWKPEVWLEHETDRDQFSPKRWSYENDIVVTIPLVKDSHIFDKEVVEFVEKNSGKYEDPICSWSEPFLGFTAQPMCDAFYFHKKRNYEKALYWCSKIMSDDWRVIATNWIKKRQENWEANSVYRKGE